MKLTPITNAMKVAYLKLHGIIPETFNEEQNLSPAQHNKFLHDLMLRTSMTQDKLTLLVKYLETLPAHVHHMFESNKTIIQPVMVPVLPKAPAPESVPAPAEQPQPEQVTADPVAESGDEASVDSDTSDVSGADTQPEGETTQQTEGEQESAQVAVPESSVLEIADGSSTKPAKKKGK